VSSKQFTLQVAIPVPLFRLFDYLPGSDDNPDSLLPGSRVEVPFGPRNVVGIVISSTELKADTPHTLKHISRRLDTRPLLPSALLELIVWASRYYCFPLGESLQTALPSVIKKNAPLPNYYATKWKRTPKAFAGRRNAHRQQEILTTIAKAPNGIWQDALTTMGIPAAQLRKLEKLGYLEEESVDPLSAKEEVRVTDDHYDLNAEQQHALETLRQADSGQFTAFLLEGITGSGKTDVYIARVKRALNDGQQALVLVPEINLTPQTLKRFQSLLGTPVVALHSGLTDKNRYINWSLAKQGIAQVVIGTRSAIFTPFKNLGVIVVDEEHDASYKQMEGFRYSARDLAVKRAQLENCHVILGSATPSLESMQNAIEDKYTWIKLTHRAGEGEFPAVDLIDIRSRPLTHGCSDPLIKAIHEHLNAGNQVLVFQNRRGFSPVLSCLDCGWLSECKHCDARMTVHSRPSVLHCHHCDDKRAIPNVCPNCQSAQLQPLGAGTERLEHGLNLAFPGARIIRVDRDSMRQRDAMEDLVSEVEKGEPCLLIGTQMLAKGHDFHHVTLVAIIDADAIFFSADFRAIERGAQQLLQVAGRTGRGSKRGQVLIQTRQPEHPLFAHIIANNYSAIARSQLDERALCELPPKSRMITIRAEAPSRQINEQALGEIREGLYQRLPLSEAVQIAGPLEAAIHRKSGRFHNYLHLFFSCMKERNLVISTLPGIISGLSSRKARIAVDVDPLETH